ncbi:MAG: glycosyltransferase family 2 protein, partial [Candidatus Methylomirabilaceae bacterium]
MKVVAIIPALDEEGSIGQVVAAVPRNAVSEVIVVDNGSTDRTAEVAARNGAVVVREPRRGYGAACYAGVMAAPGADLLVFLDGDRSDVPEEVPLIVGPILRGDADLVIGSRLSGRREPGAMPPHALFGNRLASRVLRGLYGVRITDLGSFRAIRRRALLDLAMQERTFGWPVEMVAKAARRGYRIVEVPVSYRRRIGRSKVAGT